METYFMSLISFLLISPLQLLPHCCPKLWYFWIFEFTNDSKVVDSGLEALFKPATVAIGEERAICVDVVPNPKSLGKEVQLFCRLGSQLLV